ncbi:MAG: molybdopterin synthase catalytic subunit MoaE [Betaproteobacteria bacterium]
MKISVQTTDFDVGAEMAELRGAGTNIGAHIGAIASFVGLVRDMNDGSGVSTLTLEHYPGMTEKALAAIVTQAESRWELLGCTVIHRVGDLKPADQIVLVIVASSHRGHAFEACEFIMDYLKTQAPFWKKELTPQGHRWVDSRDSDAAAVSRWQVSAQEGKIN